VSSVRFDTYTLEPVQRSGDGRIRVDAYLARTGILSYFEGGQERREYRPDSEVFNPKSLASLEGAPLTNDHPSGLLGVHARGHVVGAVSNVRRDGDKIRARITVFDKSTIADMERGKVQISAGYKVELDRTPGVTPDGQRYDAIQREIFYDHAALVHSGRAGAEVRARMDSVSQAHRDSAMAVSNVLLARR
jgi:hypothetical protein